MNFRNATDDLLKQTTLEDLASKLRVSIQAVRQARAAKDSTAHRSPPAGWEKAVATLAQERAAFYQKLAKRLESQRPS
jgi:hypothetical protein